MLYSFSVAAISNYQHMLKTLQLCFSLSFVVRSLHGSAVSSAQSLTRLKSRFPSEGSRDESISSLILIVGRIHFHARVELRFSFPCWLSAGTTLSS